LFVFEFAIGQVAGTPFIRNNLFSKFSLSVTVNSSSSINFTIDVLSPSGSITEVGVVYGIAKGLTKESTLCNPNATTNKTFGTRVGAISYTSSTQWANTINQTVLSTDATNSQGTTSFYVAPYYAKLYCINNGITYYGPEIEFLPNWPTVSVVNLTWVQANLGALNVASSESDGNSYGWYYQWGKPTDGHQFINSPVTSTLSYSDNPNPGVFYSNGSYWQSTTNTNLWNGVNGVNNPCPSGWRLPTFAEWTSFINSLSPAKGSTVYSSSLKLPGQGGRDRSGTQSPQYGNTNSIYWSADGNVRSWDHYSGGYQTNIIGAQTAYGAAVRCIQN
jgi:uncharacterized protein (TIGR02145 family)